jgi:hypothetical protein
MTPRALHPATDHAARSRARIEWRSRYGGFLAIAYFEGKAVAGISGPWSGQYALTWWAAGAQPSPRLDLYDSAEAARRDVEAWARRAGEAGTSLMAGLMAPLRRFVPTGTNVVRPSRWFRRASDTVVVDGEDVDLSGMHFSAED